MGQVPGTQLAENRLLDPQPVGRPSQQSIAWQTVQSMTEAGASAVGLPDGFLMTSGVSRRPGTVLVPVDEAARKLRRARDTAGSMDTQPMVIVCTHAREAQYLADDKDSRDRRYLSSVRTIDGLHAYCGGIEASISRALAYAPFADVVCYYALRLDLAEAACFASAIRLSFPEKKLGVGFSPDVHGQQGEAIDPVSPGRKLRQLGYDYYFARLWETVFFTAFPHAAPWALFEDALERLDSGSLGESRFLRQRSRAAHACSFHRCGGIVDSSNCR
jgi:2-methylisocitrate lyase-like PEP mutase family enzyme